MLYSTWCFCDVKHFGISCSCTPMSRIGITLPGGEDVAAFPFLLSCTVPRRNSIFLSTLGSNKTTQLHHTIFILVQTSSTVLIDTFSKTSNSWVVVVRSWQSSTHSSFVTWKRKKCHRPQQSWISFFSLSGNSYSLNVDNWHCKKTSVLFYIVSLSCQNTCMSTY